MSDIDLTKLPDEPSYREWVNSYDADRNCWTNNRHALAFRGWLVAYLRIPDKAVVREKSAGEHRISLPRLGVMWMPKASTIEAFEDELAEMEARCDETFGRNR